MEHQEIESAISSLMKMKDYYQSQYEHYLVLANNASANRERVEVLLQNLSSEPRTKKLTPSEERSDEQTSTQQAFFVTPEDENHSRNGSELNQESDRHFLPLTKRSTDAALSIANGETEQTTNNNLLQSVERQKNDVNPEQTLKEIAFFKRAMKIISSISNSEGLKTLHISYYHKILEKELSRTIAPEVVKLYLNEAIGRGLIKKAHDPNCYVIPPQEPVTSEADDQILSEARDDESQFSQDWEKRNYDLPPSDKLKITLVETIKTYISSQKPKRFSIDDVIWYLYSKEKFESWSRQQKDRVRSSISNLLCRKLYLDKEWKRIRPGVYKPIVDKN